MMIGLNGKEIELMRNIWIIASREYKLYFSSPVAYMIAFILLLVLGIFFFLNLLNSR